MSLLAVSLAPLALAGEGMWLPEQMPALSSELSGIGITLPASALSDPLAPPMAAVVGLGFCSASFVSPEGLLLTNLHCIDSFVSYASRDGENLVAEGFVAADRASERAAGPAARLYVLESVTDVTEAVRSRMMAAKVTDGERLAVAERAVAEIVAKCERRGRRCEVAAFDGGSTWRLLQSLEIRDVRIAYSPPEGVGFFGGDLDNFEWPRHDADFGVLRAYVGRNGKPAAPSPRNVPYRPPHWLSVDPDGVAPGEPVLVIGYPAGTERWLLPEELRFAYESDNPAGLDTLGLSERLLAEEAEASPVAAERLFSWRSALANERKYLRGIQDNVGGSTVLADKDALAAAVDAAADEPTRRALAELRAAIAQRQAGAARDHALLPLVEASILLDVAHTAYRWSLERAGGKKDLDREPGLQDRDRDDIVDGWAEIDESLWLPAERRLLRELLQRYAALPEADRVPEIDRWLADHGGAERASEALFTEPALARSDERLALLSRSAAQLEASTDPLVSLAVVLERSFLGPRRAAARARQGIALRTRPLWVAAARAAARGQVYPDANGTLRVTFGTVRGYAPRDGLEATPQTALRGIVEKDLRPEYTAPDWLLDGIASSADSPWRDAALGDVPVNFLSNVDTTGGNSGSPTLGADGRLVGLVFDGNYESMAADWQFDPDKTRSIHVDIRYMLWLWSLDPAAAWIPKEMGL